MSSAGWADIVGPTRDRSYDWSEGMLRTIGLFAALALLVSGCTATAQPAKKVGADGFAPTEQVTSLNLPFDSYTPSLAALYMLSNAQDQLTRDCMEAAGMDWKVISRPITVKDYRNRRRYGVIEAPIAQEYGYHVPIGLLTPIAVEQQYDAREKSLTQQQKEAAYSKNGCAVGAARRFATKVNTDRLAQLDRKSLQSSLHDASVAAELKSWQGCMERHDLRYRDPFEALSDARWWADESAGPSIAERNVASVDVECKQSSGLITAWHAAEVRIQKTMIHQNAGYLRTIDAGLKRQVALANAVLSK